MNYTSIAKDANENHYLVAHGFNQIALRKINAQNYLPEGFFSTKTFGLYAFTPMIFTKKLSHLTTICFTENWFDGIAARLYLNCDMVFLTHGKDYWQAVIIASMLFKRKNHQWYFILDKDNLKLKKSSVVNYAKRNLVGPKFFIIPKYDDLWEDFTKEPIEDFTVEGFSFG
jgi:hypothetical protein